MVLASGGGREREARARGAQCQCQRAREPGEPLSLGKSIALSVKVIPEESGSRSHARLAASRSGRPPSATFTFRAGRTRRLPGSRPELVSSQVRRKPLEAANHPVFAPRAGPVRSDWRTRGEAEEAYRGDRRGRAGGRTPGAAGSWRRLAGRPSRRRTREYCRRLAPGGLRGRKALAPASLAQSLARTR